MHAFTIISFLILLAVAAASVIHLCLLRKKLNGLNATIKANKYFIRLGDVSAEHVSEKQLFLANRAAEEAIQKGIGINNFDQQVRPLLDFVTKNTEKMIDSNLSDTERHEIGLSVSRTVKTLTDMVENVLLMARIDSDRIHYNRDCLQVGEIIKDIYEEFCSQDGECFSTKEGEGCNLGVIEGRPSLCITADLLYLKRAIREVMKNAYIFSRRGDILIGWFYRLATDEVEIFIEDNGIGISEESQKRLFDVFFKENNTSMGGLGIGLPIAKELVEKMGGRIIVASRLDVGTRVSILFPMFEDTLRG